jgi:uncharacterized protein (TIGR02246 family)
MRKLLVCSLLMWMAVPMCAQVAERSRAEIETFNRQFVEATRQMDNTAIVELWAEDGISLLPATKPIVGKAAIQAFMESVTSQLKGARMERFELQCSGIEVTGEMATEWCVEHQVVHLADGKPPYDGRGHMLLVLRRGADGKWRLLREMWNQAEAE